MVEVDPMLLVAAGSIAAGLAAAAFCLRGSSKVIESKTINKKTEQSASVKQKKSKKPTAKKNTASTNDSSATESDETAEIAAIIADVGHVDLQHKSAKKSKEVIKTKEVGPSASEIAATKAAAKRASDAAEAVAKQLLKIEAEKAEIAARHAEMLLKEEEEAKKKKAKETPDQRVARLERQKLAKVKKVEEELSKTAAMKLAASETELVSSLVKASASVPGQGPVHVDGWAVVEDKRKVKAKVVTQVVVAKTVAETSSATEPSAPIDFAKAEISVEGKKIGSIIGPKGVTLHGIQDATGVEINTPKGDRDNAAPVIITITGTADGVARASRAINDLCTKGYTKLLAGEDFKEGSIEVHPSFLSEIIGKSGINIRAIQDFTGVKLNIPQVSREHILPVKITIAGNKDKVQQAKDIIKELTQYFHTTITHPGQIHVEMDVPSALYNYIIGARGSEIKHIQGNFKVSVHIPNSESAIQSVIIVGEPQGVKGAEKYIQKIIDQAVSDREAAEKMADSWVDQEAEEKQEDWMLEFSHPSRREAVSGVVEESRGTQGGYNATQQSGGIKLGVASTAAVAASASAWGASVLASAEGW